MYLILTITLDKVFIHLFLSCSIYNSYDKFHPINKFEVWRLNISEPIRIGFRNKIKFILVWENSLTFSVTLTHSFPFCVQTSWTLTPLPLTLSYLLQTIPSCLNLLLMPILRIRLSRRNPLPPPKIYFTCWRSRLNVNPMAFTTISRSANGLKQSNCKL